MSSVINFCNQIGYVDKGPTKNIYLGSHSLGQSCLWLIWHILVFNPSLLLGVLSSGLSLRPLKMGTEPLPL